MTVINRQSIIAKNGCTIQATFFRPDGEPKAAALIVPAMGVSQSYYAPFATWLATQGLSCRDVRLLRHRAIEQRRPPKARPQHCRLGTF